MRSTDLSPGIRALIVVEVTVFVLLITFYAWFALPTKHPMPLWPVLFWIVMIPYPFVFNWLHGATFKESGVRFDNFKASAREVGIWFVVAALFLAVVGLIVDGWHGKANFRLVTRAGWYAFWGPLQQYLLCSYMLMRIRQAGFTKGAAAVTAAILFGFVHSPNWPLVAVTTIFGCVNCLLFMRVPNIFTIGIAHGLLGTLLHYAWPLAWMQKLTVGGRYLYRLAQQGLLDFL